MNEPVKGAIIESMQHHGQGVYSGTFSGKPFIVKSYYWTIGLLTESRPTTHIIMNSFPPM